MSIKISKPKPALNNYCYNRNVTNGKTWFRKVFSYIKLYMSRINSQKYELIDKTTP